MPKIKLTLDTLSNTLTSESGPVAVPPNVLGELVRAVEGGAIARAATAESVPVPIPSETVQAQIAAFFDKGSAGREILKTPKSTPFPLGPNASPAKPGPSAFSPAPPVSGDAIGPDDDIPAALNKDVPDNLHADIASYLGR